MLQRTSGSANDDEAGVKPPPSAHSTHNTAMQCLLPTCARRVVKVLAFVTWAVYGLYSYGLHSYGLHDYGLHSYSRVAKVLAFVAWAVCARFVFHTRVGTTDTAGGGTKRHGSTRPFFFRMSIWRRRLGLALVFVTWLVCVRIIFVYTSLLKADVAHGQVDVYADYGL